MKNKKAVGRPKPQTKAVLNGYIEPVASWRNPMTVAESRTFVVTDDLKKAAKVMVRAMYAESLAPKKPDNLIGVEKVKAEPLTLGYPDFIDRPTGKIEDISESDYKVE